MPSIPLYLYVYIYFLNVILNFKKFGCCCTGFSPVAELAATLVVVPGLLVASLVAEESLNSCHSWVLDHRLRGLVAPRQVGSSPAGNQTRLSCVDGGFFTSEPAGKLYACI